MLTYSGRILIVDDDSAMQGLLQARLEAAGYETVTASDGNQALHSLDKSRFDLAVLDYLMPRMDGLGVLEKIAEHRISVGIVLLTAFNDVGLTVEAMRRGALDCVVKLPPPEAFLITLDEAMERHWAQYLGLPPLPSWRGHDLSLNRLKEERPASSNGQSGVSRKW